MWYAITEFIWGSSDTTPRTRAKSKVEEGWILVDTDKAPPSGSVLDVEEIKEVDDEITETECKTITPLRRSPIKRKVEDYPIIDEEKYNPKLNRRAKYLRDSRRVLSEKDYKVITVKRGAVGTKKLPTSRQLKREELQQSFCSTKGKTTRSKTYFQPRGKNH